MDASPPCTRLPALAALSATSWQVLSIFFAQFDDEAGSRVEVQAPALLTAEDFDRAGSPTIS